MVHRVLEKLKFGRLPVSEKNQRKPNGLVQKNSRRIQPATGRTKKVTKKSEPAKYSNLFHRQSNTPPNK